MRQRIRGTPGVEQKLREMHPQRAIVGRTLDGSLHGLQHGGIGCTHLRWAL
jgi:hypothetical protein